MNSISNPSRTRLWQSVTVIAIFVGALVIDQIIKVSVKTGMLLHESIDVFSWFKITFIENNGMAFGMEFFDKIFLTSFRLIATVALAWYIARLIRRGVQWGYLICISLIMAGAAGNIIDCVFYGLIFNSPENAVASFVPFGEGYSSWFYGRVVDMFYFPICEWTWPDWIPFLGGERQVFFSYIFNFADACISCGVVALLIFYRRCVLKELE